MNIEKKEVKLTVRMTEEENKKLARWAERSGLPKAEYVRQRVLDHEPQPLPNDVFWKRLDALYAIHDQVFRVEAKKNLQQLILDIQAEATQPKEVSDHGNHQPVAH